MIAARLASVFLIAVFAVTVNIGNAAKQDPLPDVQISLQQVTPNVYYVQGASGVATDNAGFVSNAGFVVTGEGVVVFDALGTPALAQRLIELVRSVTERPVRFVVLSHFHADHAYGLQVFEELGAEILASAGSRDYLSADIAGERLEERRRSLVPWVNEQTRLVIPDRFIDGDHHFTLGQHAFVASNLGSAHSEGDMTLFVEPDNVLFSGDIIFEGRIPFLGSANTRNWLQTLRRMQETDVAALIPGHGPARENPREMLALTTRYLAYMREQMGKAVEDWVPFDEACLRAGRLGRVHGIPRLPRGQPAQCLCRVFVTGGGGVTG
jgi:glyoxylase-like metal-dependent hydrolase (beta-lactamase superfamily II)